MSTAMLLLVVSYSGGDPVVEQVPLSPGRGVPGCSRREEGGIARPSFPCPRTGGCRRDPIYRVPRFGVGDHVVPPHPPVGRDQSGPYAFVPRLFCFQAALLL